MRNYSNQETENFRKRAHDLIPSGAHTYSRSDSVFSENAPAFFTSGKGAICRDPQGREFIDYGLSLCSVTLGHAFPDVTEAIKHQLDLGNSFSRPSLLEGELAEELLDLFQHGEMIKFSKNGSDVTSAAIRIARSYTNRDLVIRIKEQPFHSFNDWFIGSTSKSGGVPQVVKDMVLRGSYNDIEVIKNLFDAHPGKIAAIILEPMTFEEPKNEFLQKLRSICHQNGALFILDEIITGFRWDLKGAQHLFRVEPDLFTIGKGFSNGFPCSALLGKREFMELGTLEGPVFLLSCTNGAELVGLTAAKATLKVYKSQPVISHIWEYGKKLMEGMDRLIAQYDLRDIIKIQGYPCRPGLFFHPTEFATMLELKTLFVQEMVKGGVLMDQIAISFSHGEKELSKTLETLDSALNVFARAIKTEDIKGCIEGKTISPVFHY